MRLQTKKTSADLSPVVTFLNFLSLERETVSQSSSFIRQATTNGCRRGALKIPLYPPLKKRGNFLQPG